ncbi:putative phosphoglycerate mutase [Apostasia shenzhenica]|uniref:Putative phosphoglycerate mutase n=1 Tax=Apostasia shenzhenica TaxID=1088818 RepID=A0A2I0AKN8_9ASPA|nr:putative phosphoglycerate mutase [Apostasia shenzhenica]
MAAAGECKGSAPAFAEFVIVRHGETSYNAFRILQGHIDSELNNIGRQQAVAVASRLSKETKCACIYSSDLQRAAETAHIIASSCKITGVVLDPSLRERHLGDLQGLTLRDAQKQKPKAYKLFLSSRRDQEIPGGGESLNQLHGRCTSLLEELAGKHQGERVIIVTHGGVLRELYRRASSMASPEGKIKNASVNIIHISENCRNWSIHKWGDVSHLEETGANEDAFGGDNASG